MFERLNLNDVTHFLTICTPLPLIVTLFSIKALVISSQNPRLSAQDRDVIYGRPLDIVLSVSVDLQFLVLQLTNTLGKVIIR